MLTNWLKKKPPSKPFVCPICEETIKDSSTSSTSQQSILCEGTCSTWLHRKCAGLTKEVFQNLSKSKKPFLCSQCAISKHEEEIASLKSTIQDLTEKLASIQAKATSGDCSGEGSAPKSTTLIPKHMVSNSSHRSQQSSERSYNVVVYGIEESPPKTARPERSKHDQENLSSTFASIDPSIQNSAIKDFHRLGKYKTDQNRPRPILVKFLRAIDAQSVLTNRDKVSQPIIIKPDMSKEDRDIQSVLLRERWNLIQTGVDRRSIKIRNNCLYLNNKHFGKVQGNKFFCSDSPSVSNLSDPNTTSDAPNDFHW